MGKNYQTEDVDSIIVNFMRRACSLVIVSIITGLFLLSCEQPTMLSVSQSELLFEEGGGIKSVIVTSNKMWTASSNQGWLSVSPSSGEGNVTFSVLCEENNTYDIRTGTITIVSEELTQTITVTQAAGFGLLISRPEYNLSNEAQTISVEIQANVLYTVDIDYSCRDWIKQESTKGLSSNIINFTISKNETYDEREGKITIRQTNGSISVTVIVKQSQNNGLFAERTAYEVSYAEQQLDIKVKSNVDYDVIIDDSCKDWISIVQTKGLKESSVKLAIAKNDDAEREGEVVFMYRGIQEMVRIKQEGGFVIFEDAEFKAYCINSYDKDSDGELSFNEAMSVTFINCDSLNISSLSGIEYFTNLVRLQCNNNQLTSLDVSNNELLEWLYCSNNQLTILDISNNTALLTVYCPENHLTSLDVSKNNKLIDLFCNDNQLSSLDVSKNTALSNLFCNDNFLTSLDVSNNELLKWLHCSNNQLRCLDVSNNPVLFDLRCENNKLTSLNVGKITSLYLFTCRNNQLTSLCVCNNTALTYLSCSDNQLTSLDVRNDIALQQLYCENNRLGCLDISTNIAVADFFCHNNQMTSLDVSNNTALTRLACHYNELRSLDVSNNRVLENLYCHCNQLTSLDVSKNAALVSLWCAENQINILDVSNNNTLKQLVCGFDPYLKEIWLMKGQVITDLQYDSGVATIKYK